MDSNTLAAIAPLLQQGGFGGRNWAGYQPVSPPASGALPTYNPNPNPPPISSLPQYGGQGSLPPWAQPGGSMIPPADPVGTIPFSRDRMMQLVMNPIAQYNVPVGAGVPGNVPSGGMPGPGGQGGGGIEPVGGMNTGGGGAGATGGTGLSPIGGGTKGGSTTGSAFGNGQLNTMTPGMSSLLQSYFPQIANALAMQQAGTPTGINPLAQNNLFAQLTGQVINPDTGLPGSTWANLPGTAIQGSSPFNSTTGAFGSGTQVINPMGGGASFGGGETVGSAMNPYGSGTGLGGIGGPTGYGNFSDSFGSFGGDLRGIPVQTVYPELGGGSSSGGGGGGFWSKLFGFLKSK